MKKLLAVFITLTLLIQDFSIPVSAETGNWDDTRYWTSAAADRYAGGSGTSSDPFLISAPKQLAKMALDCYWAAGSNKYFKLTADINLSQYEWFSGTLNGNLDGNGKTISGLHGSHFLSLGAEDVVRNLNFDRTGNFDQSSKIYCPIFYVNDGLIENCKVNGNVSVTVKNTDDVYGNDLNRLTTLCFVNQGTIKNCAVTGNYKIEAVDSNVGASFSGFCGPNFDGIIENCTVNANITAKSSFHAAAYGFAEGNLGKINNCRVAGNVTADAGNSGAAYAYGLCGSSGNGDIPISGPMASNCIVTANVSIICAVAAVDHLTGYHAHDKIPAQGYSYCRIGEVGGMAAGISYHSNANSNNHFLGTISSPLGAPQQGSFWYIAGTSHYNRISYFAPIGGRCSHNGELPQAIQVFVSRNYIMYANPDNPGNPGDLDNPPDYVPDGSLPPPTPLVKTSDVTINVIDISGQPIADASISLADKYAATNASGSAALQVPFGQTSLTIDAYGYNTYNSLVNINSAAYTQTITLDSIIRDVTIESPSIGGRRTLLGLGQVMIDTSDKTPYILTADVNWPDNSKNIWLVDSSGKRIPFSNGVLSIAFNEGFTGSESFFMETASGNQTEKIPINLKLDDSLAKWVENLSKTNIETKGFDLSSLIKWLPGYSLKLNGGLVDDVNRGFSAKIADGKAVINYEADNLPFTIINDAVGVSLVISGAFPMDALKNNEYTDVSVAISSESRKTMANKKKPLRLFGTQIQTAAGPVPVVVKFYAESSFGVNGKYSIKGLDRSTEKTEISLPISATLGAVGAVGVRDVLNAGIFGDGTISTEYRLYPYFDVKDPTAKGRFGIELEFLTHVERFTLITIPNENEGIQTFMLVPADEGFSPIGRSYLNNNAISVLRFGGDDLSANIIKEVLKSNVFPNTYVRLHGEHFYLLTDDTDRDEINGMTLSRDGDAMYDNGTSDGNFDVSENFVVWEKNNEVLPETADFNASLSGKEIVFSSAPAAKPIQLTNNNHLDYFPKISAHDGRALVAWLSNTENDVFGQIGITSVHYALYDGSAFSPAKAIENVGAAAGLSVYYDENNAYVSYGADGSIYVINAINGETKEIIPDGYGASLFGHNSYVKIVFADEEGIKIAPITGGGFENVETENAKQISVVQNGAQYALLWIEPKNGYDALYASWYDYSTGTWSEKNLIISGDYNVKNYSAFWKDDGDVDIRYLQAEKTQFDDDGGIVSGRADLCVLTVTPDINIMVDEEGIVFDEKIYGSLGAAIFTVPVTNIGQKIVHGLRYELYNGEPGGGNWPIESGEYQYTLKAGETVELDVFAQMYSRGAKDMYIKVLPMNGQDVDESDNMARYSIGTSLLRVTEAYFEESGDSWVLNAGVANDGGANAEGIKVTLHADGESGDEIFSENIDSLVSMEEQKVQWMLPKANMGDIGLYKEFYVTAESAGRSDAMLAVLMQPVLDDIDVILSGVYKKPDEDTMSTQIDIANNTGEVVEAVLFAALYGEKGELASLMRENLRLEAGERKEGHEITLWHSRDDKKYRLKVFVWDGENRMMPLLKRVPIGDVEF